VALPVTLHRRRYQDGDTEGFHLVLAATGDRELEAAIFAASEQSATLMNAVDNPEACTFFLPAILRSGDLRVAISTGGVSPAVASWVRDRVATVLGGQFSDVLDIVGATRDEIRSDGRSSEGLAWADLIDELTSVLAGGADLNEALQVAAAWLARIDKTTKD
jgi:siroheme synthase-like protein